jgi:hypothetical protein
MQMQRSGDIVLRDPRVMTIRDEGDVDEWEVPLEFDRGWAVRPGRGKNYGRRYAAPFVKDIEQLFTAGLTDQSNKLGPGRMVEILRDRYPGRFDLPSENEVRQEIAKIKMRTKRTLSRIAAPVIT